MLHCLCLSKKAFVNREFFQSVLCPSDKVALSILVSSGALNEVVQVVPDIATLGLY